MNFAEEEQLKDHEQTLSTADEIDMSWLRDNRQNDKRGDDSAKASIVTVDGHQDRLSYVTRDKMDDFEPITEFSSAQNEGKKSVAQILKKSKSLNVKHA